jgi:2-polyprenyl-3-methyl-5-hydroxy-6-metoxy-1,4-benzoquinol methylase
MKISDLQPYLEIKDHAVSGETFSVLKSAEYDLLATFPQPEDLGKYYESEDYISHTDGKRSVFEKAYHLVKSVALKQKCSLLARHAVEKGRLLDIGAGTGDFLAAAKADGWNVTGVEPSEKARSIADRKGLSLYTGTDAIQDGTYDAITMWHVLEHVPDPEAQAAELKRLLKPDGVLIVAVPNFNSYDAKQYGNFWAAYDVPRHLWHFSQKSIRMIFAKQKMGIVDIRPMKFDAFYVSLLSEKYRTGKMHFLKAFLTGLRSNAKAAGTSEYSSLIYVLKNTENAF